MNREVKRAVKAENRILSSNITGNNAGMVKMSAGLVLAENITSEVNSPPYDKALMDGYAVRTADREPQRRVLEEIAAGDVPRFPLTPGTASRIMTGAPIPEGADAVVPVELTEMVGDSVV